MKTKLGPNALLPCVLFGILLRWCVSLFPYSGQGKPPMYGDYEAQRHWMEITVNLPMNEWYRNTTRNDLQYWGLDYPPLSAYHSYGLGKCFKRLLPESVVLFKSRGYESAVHKFLMRTSVFLSDLMILGLPLYYLTLKNFHLQDYDSNIYGLAALIAPPFIMVDYGHFQFNSVSLGLTTIAVVLLFYDQTAASALCFTLAVHHKQMSLYHAAPFFCQLVGKLIIREPDLLSAFRVASAILPTIGLMWAPFGDYWIYAFRRVFPVKRGVFEDKVGTFWYFLDRIFPIKTLLTQESLVMACGITTIILMFPSCWNHFKKVCSSKTSDQEGKRAFLLSLLNVSLIFFLFSYHVHEKSILLPCLPAVMLMPFYPTATCWFIIVASLSMYPLFYEEDSHIALALLVVIFIAVSIVGRLVVLNSTLKMCGFCSSIGSYVVLILGLHFLPPPEKFPHLFQAGVALCSFLHYIAFCGYFHYAQLFSFNQQNIKSKTKKSK